VEDLSLKKKIKQWSYNHVLGREKTIHVLRGFFILFFIKQRKYEINLGF
jgi:hypothetical protein